MLLVKDFRGKSGRDSNRRPPLSRLVETSLRDLIGLVHYQVAKTVILIWPGGEFKCPKENGFECYRQAESKYKFYLSFENAMCRDYVTEKFFTVYSLNMIPGGWPVS